MDYRQLGCTGIKVSELCLGTMQFGWTADESMAHNILSKAFETGINFIDTADIYSTWVKGNPGGVSESIIGNWLKKSSIPRDQIIIATKVRGAMGTDPNSEGLSRHHIMNAIEGSLSRLGVDYIDLYQAHWYDEATPIEETLNAFDTLVKQGKVRYIGASNYPAWRLMQSLWIADSYHLSRYDSLQPHYNLVHRAEFERELMQVCKQYNLGVIPYSPLAGGFLTGKYRRDQIKPDSERLGGVQRRYFNDHGWKVLETLDNIAQENHLTVSQSALVWLLSNDVITSPIIGPRNIEQLQDNLGAVGKRFSQEELSQLNNISSWIE